MSQLLIVDDDTSIRELMKLYLKNEGFDILEATNGTQALSIIESQQVVLVILDIMMPEMDGWELTKKIRKNFSDLPLLMVSAKGETVHRIKGFQLGTDDYLTKPFDPFELVLRVKALLKRAKISASQLVELETLTLNKLTYDVINKDEKIILPPKEFELLFVLASYPNQIFTREQLITRIWGIDYEGDNRTVDVHIKRIREKFTHESDVFFIESVRGLGYRLVIL
ncbi:response regulator transcription factor [Vagococcus hydrophili]|uniref:Heme response regulator HssR n=1 Tax=Vagococcus hydrophili TaxID=2714947 RepID=A0A6G8AS99_9ENTE|nr:response regulator transcription factor [Vagococcus hydrophili]QIL47876.1 response regulator transcription factor [Vagococcus hydrophili]